MSRDNSEQDSGKAFMKIANTLVKKAVEQLPDAGADQIKTEALRLFQYYLKNTEDEVSQEQIEAITMAVDIAVMKLAAEASTSKHCKSCGAEIEYAAGSQSLVCLYCGANNEIHKAENQLPVTVEKVIPMSVSQEDLERRVYAYMATGDYTPDDMLEAATFVKKERFYVPAFGFRVSYEATWTASFGYDREESYTAYRTVTRNNRQHQEAYTAYKTVTDWRPANGVDSGIFSVSTYAGKKLFEPSISANAGTDLLESNADVKSSGVGIKSLADKFEALANRFEPLANKTKSLAQSINSFGDTKPTESVVNGFPQDESGFAPAELVTYAIANGSMTDYNPSFTSGLETEKFSVPEASAFASLKNEINSNINRRVKKRGQGDRQKDWHWNATTSHSTQTISVPICHAIFEYAGVEYHVWIDGIGAAGLRADKLPKDKGRRKSVYLGFLPAGFASATLIISALKGTFTPVEVMAAAVFVWYAVARRKSILGYSTKIRDSLLTQIHASSNTAKNMSSAEQDKAARSFELPKKPRLAKTHYDKFILPVLSVLAIFLVNASNKDSLAAAANEKALAAQRVANPAPAPIPAPPPVAVQPAFAPATVEANHQAEIAANMMKAVKEVVSNYKRGGVSGMISMTESCYETLDKLGFSCAYIDLASRHLDQSISAASHFPPSEYFGESQCVERLGKVFAKASLTVEQSNEYLNLVMPEIDRLVDAELSK